MSDLFAVVNHLVA